MVNFLDWLDKARHLKFQPNHTYVDGYNHKKHITNNTRQGASQVVTKNV